MRKHWCAIIMADAKLKDLCGWRENLTHKLGRALTRLPQLIPLHTALANTAPVQCRDGRAWPLSRFFSMCMCAFGGQPVLGVILRDTVHFSVTVPLTELDGHLA